MKQDRIWQNKIIIFLVIACLGLGIYLLMANDKIEQKQIDRSKNESISNNLNKNSVAVDDKDQVDSKNTPCVNKLRSLDEIDRQKLTIKWENIHLDIEGEIYRIRDFYDDGNNGEVKKLIIYKEDKDEFPRIVKTYLGKDQVDKQKEVWLKKGVKIHQEIAYDGKIDDKEIFYEVINDKVSRYTVNGISKIEECD